MINPIVKTIELPDGRTITLETGKLAKQADGSVTVSYTHLIWVFLIMIFFYKEKAGAKKIIGISIGLIGALVCILTQQSDD